MRHARSGRMLIQFGAIIALGAALGIADAMFRPIDLSPRQAPPDPKSLLGGVSTGTPSSSGGTPTTNQHPATTTPSPNEAVPAPEVSPAPTPQPPAATPAAGFVPTPQDKLPQGQITIETARAFYDKGVQDSMTFFVDARKIEDFAAGHIQSAIRMDTKSFEKGDPPELGLIPRQAIVVVYCNGGHCDESENVAKRISGSGYQNVYVLHDGYPGWKALGHPVQTGE